MYDLRTFVFVGLIILHTVTRVESSGHLQIGFFLYEFKHRLPTGSDRPKNAPSKMTPSDDVITDDGDISVPVVPWQLRSQIPSAENNEKEEESPVENSVAGVLPWDHETTCNGTSKTWVRYRFLLCVDYAESESSSKSCRLAHVEMERFVFLGAIGRDLVTFPSTLDLTPKGTMSSNPLIFGFDRWKGNVRMSVYVACCGVEAEREGHCDEVLSYTIRQSPAPFALKMIPASVVLEGSGSLSLSMLLQCDEGYYGPGCDVQCHVDYPSVEHMFCNITSGHMECLPGWEGPQCQIDTDECRFSYCHNDAHCVNSPPGSFTCLCKLGTSGRLCEKSTRICHTKPCQNGGTCEDTAFGFLCFCTSSFMGSFCERIAPSISISDFTNSSMDDTADAANDTAQELTHHNKTTTIEAKYLYVWEPWYTAIVVSVFLIFVIGIGCVIKTRLVRRSNASRSSLYKGILDATTYDNNAFDDDDDEFDDDFDNDTDNTNSYENIPPRQTSSRRASGVETAENTREATSAATGRNKSTTSTITMERRQGRRQGRTPRRFKHSDTPRSSQQQREEEEEEGGPKKTAVSSDNHSADPGLSAAARFGDYEGLPNLLNPERSPFMAHRTPTRLPCPSPRRSASTPTAATPLVRLPVTPPLPGRRTVPGNFKVPVVITPTTAAEAYQPSEDCTNHPQPPPETPKPPPRSRGSPRRGSRKGGARVGLNASSSRSSLRSSLHSSASSSSSSKNYPVFRRSGRVFTIEGAMSAGGCSDSSISSGTPRPSHSPKPRGSVLGAIQRRRNAAAASAEPRLCSIRRVDSGGYEMPVGQRLPRPRPAPREEANPYHVLNRHASDEHVYDKIFPEHKAHDKAEEGAFSPVTFELPLDPRTLPDHTTASNSSSYRREKASPGLAYTLAYSRRNSVGDEVVPCYIELESEATTYSDEAGPVYEKAGQMSKSSEDEESVQGCADGRNTNSNFHDCSFARADRNNHDAEKTELPASKARSVTGDQTPETKHCSNIAFECPKANTISESDSYQDVFNSDTDEDSEWNSQNYNDIFTRENRAVRETTAL